jgi:hypothetical protein
MILLNICAPNVGAQAVTLHYPDDPANADVTRAPGNFSQDHFKRPVTFSFQPPDTHPPAE